MARMFPSKFPFPNNPKHAAEKRFFNQCREQLGDSWIVLYGIDWFGHRDGRSKDGEADFLLMNQEVGILVVEVKGGRRIEVLDGEWFTTPHGSDERKPIKDPFRQGAASKAFFIEYLRKSLPKVRLSQVIGVMAAFPGHKQTGDMSPLGRRFKICDRFDMKNLEETLRKSARAQGLNLTTDENLLLIKEILVPSFTLDLNVYFDIVDDLEKLTDQQLRAFSMLRKQRQLTIIGGPGTGKTVLAFNRARELASEGLQTLYLCHSTTLAQQLRENLGHLSPHLHERLHIKSVHEFISETSHLSSDDSMSIRSEEDLIEFHLIQSLDPKNQLDVLIADEAQDIPALAFELACVLLKKEGQRFIFGDRNQGTSVLIANALGTSGQLHRPGDQSALDHYGDDLPIELDLNCRSTREIAEFSERFVGRHTDTSSMEQLSVVDGFPVEVRRSPIDVWPTVISEVVSRWTKEYDLSPNRIALIWEPSSVVSMSLMGNSVFGDDRGMLTTESCVVDWFGYASSQIRNSPFGYSYDAHMNLVHVRSFLFDQHDRELPSDLGLRELLFNSWRREQAAIGRLRPMRHMGEGDANDVVAREIEFMADRPSISAVPAMEFLGLESEAVIVVVPPLLEVGHKGDEFELIWRRIVYGMTTRARTLLTVLVDPITAKHLRI